jgi:hypothetical protein
MVTQINTPPLFYKKDAVCTINGVIKVVSTQEGATVQISINGKNIASKQIVNREVILTDLDVNSYIVTIGDEWKLINIILKER